MFVKKLVDATVSNIVIGVTKLALMAGHDHLG